jgi:hypothetical protein
MTKIFRLNDTDWYAGEDLESVKSAYLKDTGLEQDEAFDDPHELSDEEMERLKFTRDDQEKVSFRVELTSMIASGCTFPRMFASTEY